MSTVERPLRSTPRPANLARSTWAVVAVILLGDVMDLLDALVTNVAGPTVLRDLHAGQSFIQWLSAGYTVAMAGGLLIGGRLGDRFGRRRVFLAGMAGFATASLAAGLAAGPAMLITARVLQGLLGALMLPQGLGILKDLLPDDRAGAVFSLFGPVMGAAAVGGPLLAGFLVDADVLGTSWRMIFFLNVPLAAAGVLVGTRRLPRTPADPAIGADYRGGVMAAAGMAALVFPLVQGRSLHWPWWTFLLAATGIALLVAFAASQEARRARGLPTLVEPSLLHNRSFVGASALGLFLFSALMGATLPLTLLLQQGLRFSPLHAGLVLSTQAAGMLVGFAGASRLGTRRTTLQLGATVAIAGNLAVVAALALQGTHQIAWWLAPGLAVTGAGMGIAMTPFFSLVIAGVTTIEAGSASAAFTAIQQVGGALGVAVLGTAFFAVLDRSTGNLLGFSHATELAVGTAAALLAVTVPLARLLPAGEVPLAEP